jgi:hypothetical protein
MENAMSNLTHEDRALLDLARDGHQPTDADRGRVRVALVARMGVGTGLAVTTAAATSAASAGAAGATGTGAAIAGLSTTLTAMKVTAAVVMAGAIGGGGFAAYRGARLAHTPLIVTSAVSAQEQPAEAARFTDRTALAPAPAPVSDLALVAAESPQRRSGPEPLPKEDEGRNGLPVARSPETGASLPATLLAPPPSAAAPLDVQNSTPAPEEASSVLPRLGQEVAAPLAPTTVEAETRLVRAGVTALHSGDSARALALFDEHARKYPRGILAEERAAERVVALCDLGRSVEARAAATEFLRDHPRSPASARVHASCAVPTNP